METEKKQDTSHVSQVGVGVIVRSLREKAKELAKKMRCNCDLDNWQPDTRTGHSWVCRIHRAAIGNPLYY